MDRHMATSFDSLRPERPQEKLVPSLLLLPRVPSTVCRAGAMLSNIGLSGAAWGSGQDLVRL